MKIFFCVAGGVFFLFAIFSIFFSYRPSITSFQSYQELALADRPSWARWRAEGQGVTRFFLHFLDYRKKAKAIVLNPFPGQKSFFSSPKQLLADLPQPLSSEPYVRIGFLGDLMEVPNTDKRFIAPEILTFLQRMDFVLGNLETPVSQSGSISKFRNSISQFNVPTTYLDALSINGKSVFHFLSLANNHILDRGDLGVQETILNVKAKGLLVHGAEQNKFVLFSKHGIRFGISTATWGVNPQIFQSETKSPIWYLQGIAPLDKGKINLTQLKDALTEMKKAGVDFKILFLHWGFEFETFPDPMMQEIGRELIHSGADLIIGSHPHVLQPFEIVQTEEHIGLIAYSMGNFISTMTNPFTRIGLIQELNVWRNTQKEIKWSLGSSRLTQVIDVDQPQTVFVGLHPAKDLLDAIEYYKQSLDLPFLR